MAYNVNLITGKGGKNIGTINHFYYPTNALNYIKLRD